MNLFVFFHNDKGNKRFFVEVVFELGVNVYRLRVHLCDDPAIFQQFVDTNQILIVIDVRLLRIISTVADVDDLLDRFPPPNCFILGFALRYELVSLPWAEYCSNIEKAWSTIPLQALS